MAFIDQGEFEVVKTPSGWEAARYDEHQFCAKIKVSAWGILVIVVWQVVWTKNTKNGTFATAHFCV